MRRWILIYKSELSLYVTSKLKTSNEDTWPSIGYAHKRTRNIFPSEKNHLPINTIHPWHPKDAKNAESAVRWPWSVYWTNTRMREEAYLYSFITKWWLQWWAGWCWVEILAPQSTPSTWYVRIPFNATIRCIWARSSASRGHQLNCEGVSVRFEHTATQAARGCFFFVASRKYRWN